jgi:hypothetical protein
MGASSTGSCLISSASGTMSASAEGEETSAGVGSTGVEGLEGGVGARRWASTSSVGAEAGRVALPLAEAGSTVEEDGKRLSSVGWEITSWSIPIGETVKHWKSVEAEGREMEKEVRAGSSGNSARERKMLEEGGEDEEGKTSRAA